MSFELPPLPIESYRSRTGLTFYLKPMDGEELTRFFKPGKEQAEDQCRLLAASLCDVEGNRLFAFDKDGMADKDYKPQLMRIRGFDFMQMVAKCIELNHLGEDPKKDSPGIPG